jgi:hypothetical protein
MFTLQKYRFIFCAGAVSKLRGGRAGRRAACGGELEGDLHDL